MPECAADLRFRVPACHAGSRRPGAGARRPSRDHGRTEPADHRPARRDQPGAGIPVAARPGSARRRRAPGGAAGIPLPTRSRARRIPGAARPRPLDRHRARRYGSTGRSAPPATGERDRLRILRPTGSRGRERHRRRRRPARRDRRGRRRVVRLPRSLAPRRSEAHRQHSRGARGERGRGGHEARGRTQVWADIRRDGRVVHGLSLDELRAVRSGWARSHPARVGRAGPRLRRQGRGVRRGREQ